MEISRASPCFSKSNEFKQHNFTSFYVGTSKWLNAQMSQKYQPDVLKLLILEDEQFSKAPKLGWLAIVSGPPLLLHFFMKQPLSASL